VRAPRHAPKLAMNPHPGDYPFSELARRDCKGVLSDS